ncbi:M48 family metalloprotease [bacterium]|nr:M48 family metalloprotease [bacterium]
MKKFLCLSVALLLGTSVFAGSYIDKQLKEAKKNVKHNSVKTQVRDTSYADLYIQKQDIKNIKDPKLIKLSDIEPVDEKLYQKKLKEDNEIYEKQIIPSLKQKSQTVNIEPRAVDFYKVYRIAERLIRANNLDHQNWRIAIRKTDEVNAYATDTNLIVIYTGLYDTLYTNEDALACIIAHEMAHNLLGHNKRSYEMSVRYAKMKRGAYYNKALNRGQAGLLTTSAALAYKQKMYREFRDMEYTADAEGFNMLIKAGYSPSNALYALNFLETMDPRVWVVFRDHPETFKRIESVNEIIAFANPDWVYEGKYNIYHSNVLPVKKSSDHVSIVISADSGATNYYSPETYEQRLTRLAYVSYTKGDMQNAIKYFEKLLDLKNDYVTNLYLSYANEYLYNQTHDEKYKKSAQKYVNNAKMLNSSDENVIEQYKQIYSL